MTLGASPTAADSFICDAALLPRALDLQAVRGWHDRSGAVLWHTACILHLIWCDVLLTCVQVSNWAFSKLAHLVDAHAS
jgi:hypothetical protein